MIDLITLKNFQIHKNTVLELSPGINVITGQTDQGKSSIVRALYWLFFNRPAGTEFIRTKSKECCVAITSNEKTIQRVRNSSGNRNKYVVDDEEFNALRSEVPEQVTDILSITETNIQFQDDPPFMLSLNPGEVARKLNNVVGLNQIDSSLKYVNKLLRDQNSEEKHIRKEIEKKKAQLKKYERLEEIRALHDKYEEMQEKLMEEDKRLEHVNAFISSLERTYSIVAYERDIQAVEQMIQETQQTAEKLTNNKDELAQATKYIERISRAEKRLKKQEKAQKKINADLSSLEEAINSHSKLLRKSTKIEKFINSLSEYHSSRKEVSRTLENTKDRFEKLKSSLQYCPLCEQPFQSTKRKRK